MFSGQKCDVEIHFINGGEMMVPGVSGTPGQISNMVKFAGLEGNTCHIGSTIINLDHMESFVIHRRE